MQHNQRCASGQLKAACHEVLYMVYVGYYGVPGILYMAPIQ